MIIDNQKNKILNQKDITKKGNWQRWHVLYNNNTKTLTFSVYEYSLEKDVLIGELQFKIPHDSPQYQVGLLGNQDTFFDNFLIYKQDL